MNYKIIYGGCWNDGNWFCNFHPGDDTPDNRDFHLGFRLTKKLKV